VCGCAKRGAPLEVVGVDVKRQARERNTRVATELGWGQSCSFVEGTIAGATLRFPTPRRPGDEAGDSTPAAGSEPEPEPGLTTGPGHGSAQEEEDGEAEEGGGGSGGKDVGAIKEEGFKGEESAGEVRRGMEAGVAVTLETTSSSHPSPASSSSSTLPLLPEVDIVLALHACDTATDEALARAVRWSAPLTLVSPCCHHDLQVCTSWP
jgi:hypothetical protein